VESMKSFQMRQQGSFMLEALIAILLFSIGILAMVALLGNSIRASNDARLRSEAVNLAYGMVADMWSTAPAQLDAQFGPGGAKLITWQAKAVNLFPSASANPPVVDLTQPGLSLQSRTIVVTVSWQLPGATELHQYVLTAQIGKNT
jgi:type IV pilus assembly protein PilV